MRQFPSILDENFPAHRIQRVAHPINFSAASRNALTWAIQLSQHYQAQLLLLHVIPPPTPLYEIESSIKSQAERTLSVLLARLESSAIQARGFLLTGTNSIDGQIVRAASLERVDLIVIGSRARTGISRLFAGNLASRVIARAHCPVLVVAEQ